MLQDPRAMTRAICTVDAYMLYNVYVHLEGAMTAIALTKPEKHTVNRSELRQKQSATLRLARGNSVVVISANHEEDEKLLVDKRYFDELVQKLRSVVETLEIATDRKLFSQILRAAEHLEDNTRRGKLHSFAEAFGEK